MHPDDLAPRRRDVLFAGGACAVAGILAVPALRAQPVAPPAAEQQAWQHAIKAVTGDAKVTQGRIVLDMPEIAENGNVVPFVASVDSPMSEADHVKSLRLYATGNPQPLIATFRFSSDSGKASVASRMRLARSQDVIALAELADGTFLSTRRAIKVTIGGCGG